jgi:hypothetical protein
MICAHCGSEAFSFARYCFRCSRDLTAPVEPPPPVGLAKARELALSDTRANKWIAAGFGVWLLLTVSISTLLSGKNLPAAAHVPCMTGNPTAAQLYACK